MKNFHKILKENLFEFINLTIPSTIHFQMWCVCHIKVIKIYFNFSFILFIIITFLKNLPGVNSFGKKYANVILFWNFKKYFYENTQLRFLEFGAILLLLLLLYQFFKKSHTHIKNKNWDKYALSNVTYSSRKFQIYCQLLIF